MGFITQREAFLYEVKYWNTENLQLKLHKPVGDVTVATYISCSISVADLKPDLTHRSSQAGRPRLRREKKKILFIIFGSSVMKG